MHSHLRLLRGLQRQLQHLAHCRVSGQVQRCAALAVSCCHVCPPLDEQLHRGQVPCSNNKGNLLISPLHACTCVSLARSRPHKVFQ